jgi:DUF438 domain-containing protein
MNPALPDNIHSILLNNLKDAYVFVDIEHMIRYMNSAAVSRYKDGESLIGRSIFSCHNSTSREIILEIFEKMKSGLTEEIITDNEKHRIYMRAVRDENGNLIGYYERFEPPVKR